MMRTCWAAILLGVYALGAWSQESRKPESDLSTREATVRLSGPIDFWGRGPSLERRESFSPEAAPMGPGRILVRETVWAQPIRTPDGNWMLYVPPKPILDFLENPTEEAAKAYLAWKKEQAEKLGRAMLLLGRLKDPPAPAKADTAGPKSEEARKEESTGASLIYFKKPTCPHCVSQDGILGQWLPKHSDLRLQIVLPGELPELWKSYAVRGTPTLVLQAADGKEEVLVGLQSEARLDAALKRISPPSPPDTQMKVGLR